ncbi:MAG: hypothetical protein IT365_18555 [Candidatus Hydrogenedentes bacterium]|nr:hypothetical protein [Candidatus Hydrogenedentota bacterium]
MVKGLLIRQAFVIVDLTLALLVALFVYLIAERLLRENPIAVGPGDLGGAPTETFQLPRVGPLSDYAVIETSGLFGPAANMATPAAPTEETQVVVAAPPTLTLHATAASEEPGDPQATAVIENSAAASLQKIATYYLNQPVTAELSLKEVHPRKVILENKVANTMATLEMRDPTENPAPVTPASMARGPQKRPPSAAAETANTVALNREELVQELASYNYADVVSTLNPQMAEDENGNVVGISSDNFASIPLASQVGLQNGDVVNTINGIKIDSDQKLAEIFEKFSNASSFRLGVTRNGTPMMLTFKLE